MPWVAASLRPLIVPCASCRTSGPGAVGVSPDPPPQAANARQLPVFAAVRTGTRCPTNLPLSCSQRFSKNLPRERTYLRLGKALTFKNPIGLFNSRVGILVTCLNDYALPDGQFFNGLVNCFLQNGNIVRVCGNGRCINVNGSKTMRFRPRNLLRRNG